MPHTIPPLKHIFTTTIKPTLALVAFGTLIAVIIFVHTWQLGDIPPGLSIDELSVGRNAYFITKIGQDEYGQHLPLYFRAYGDYKSPVQIYTTALLFKFVEPSNYSLRLVSAIFFLLFLLGIWLLVYQLFKHILIATYTLLAAGFLPWFFVWSRTSLESIIPQLSFTTLALLFIHKTYHSSYHSRHQYIYPISAGLFLGLSTYTYHTARLLTFILLLTCLAVYLRRKTFKKSVALLTSFTISVLPYLYYFITNSTNLTARFHEISYIFKAELSYLTKLQMFLSSYLHQFSPSFLLYHGDIIPRHATGFGGELFFIVFILAIIGLCWSITQLKKNPDRFRVFIVLNLLSVPIAGALADVSQSSARTILVGLYFLIISSYGLFLIISTVHRSGRNTIILAIYIVLIFEASLYTHHYFTKYPSISHIWFGIDTLKQELPTLPPPAD